MPITISGKHTEVGDSLSTHARQHLTALLEKYLHKTPEAQVILKKSSHLFICDLIVHLHHHLTVRCEGHDSDAYRSFDCALRKLESRIKRYRTRLRNHHRLPKESVQLALAQQYRVDTYQEDTGEDTPVVVAEMSSEIHSLTVGEAVMQLDLSESPVLIFQNGVTQKLNVVYRRPDGHIGWIDPHYSSTGS
jgi:ribosomal subunit interface protein